MGISFTVYSEAGNIDRAWPFDVIPRVISTGEWSGLTDGRIQRLLALNMFVDDDTPARLVSVYAPGLSPMDFHAVVEAHVDGSWWVSDATGLAPRTAMSRIATGRDSADTAFLTIAGDTVGLNWLEVTAYTDAMLPADDRTKARTPVVSAWLTVAD